MPEHLPPIRFQHRLRIIAIKTLPSTLARSTISEKRLSPSPAFLPPKPHQKTSPSISDRIQPLITHVNSIDRQNLALRGCDIGAAFAFVILTGAILKPRSAAKKKMKIGKADSELPLLLKSKTQENPSILDPREPPNPRGGESRVI